MRSQVVSVCVAEGDINYIRGDRVLMKSKTKKTDCKGG